jgi:iron complex transport system substrate-binding protein
MLCLKKYFLFIAIVFFSFGCQPLNNQVSKQNSAQQIELPVKYSSLFKLFQTDSGYIVSIKEPYSQNYKTYTFSHYPNSTKAINIPIRKSICLSSIYTSMFVALDNTDLICAIDNINYQTEKKILEAYSDKKITEVNVNDHLDLEKIIQLAPNVIVDYSHYYQNEVKPSVLNKTNITELSFHDYLETSVLARAEWIKIIGILCDEYEQAQTLFDSIEHQYLITKEKLQDVSKKLSRAKQVFCDMEYSGTWYIPGGKSYMAQLIKDAGAKYIFESDTNKGSTPSHFEFVFGKAQKADVWLNTGSLKTKAELYELNKKYEWFEAFKQNAIYNNNKNQLLNGANAIWNRGVIEPHLILKDIGIILYPDSFPKDTLVYYQRLN